jgi:hypothetical protein
MEYFYLGHYIKSDAGFGDDKVLIISLPSKKLTKEEVLKNLKINLDSARHNVDEFVVLKIIPTHIKIASVIEFMEDVK